MYFLYFILAVGSLIVLIGFLKKQGVSLPKISIPEKYYKHVAIGVAGLVGLIVLAVFAAKSTLDLSFWLPFGLLGLLAVAGFTGKAGKLGKMAATVVTVCLVGYTIFNGIFGDKADMVANKWRETAVKIATDEGSPPTTPAPAVAPRQEKLAKWEKTEEDGSLPVNEWSQIAHVGLGCGVKFSIGEGHRVQYRYYSKEWNDYVPGTSPNMNELRFMVTRKGVTALPYIVTCS